MKFAGGRPHRDGGEQHPDVARIAEAVEDPAVFQSLAGHLVRCQRCEALYAELMRTEVLDRSGTAVAPDELVELARSLGSSPLRVASRPSWARPAGIVAGVAAAGLATLLVIGVPGTRDDVDRESIGPVLELLAQTASDGFLLPLAEEIPAVEVSSPVFRSADLSRGDDALELAVERLVVAYENDVANPGVAEALVSAYMASGQLRNARAFLDETRASHTDRQELQVLDAILLAQEGEPDRAKSALERLRAESPLAAYNLGLLVLGTRDPHGVAEASALWREVAAREGDSPLGDRATALLRLHGIDD